MTEPGVTKARSVRDILAHVTTWEEEALKHLPLILKGGKLPRYSVTYGSIDAFNAQMTERKKGLSLRTTPTVGLSTSLSARPRINSAAKRASVRLRLDTYSHYPKHAEAIRKWREQR